MKARLLTAIALTRLACGTPSNAAGDGGADAQAPLSAAEMALVGRWASPAGPGGTNTDLDMSLDVRADRTLTWTAGRDGACDVSFFSTVIRDWAVMGTDALAMEPARTCSTVRDTTCAASGTACDTVDSTAPFRFMLSGSTLVLYRDPPMGPALPGYTFTRQ